MYVATSKMVQFDKFIHPVVLYENHLICIFMNVYENSQNDGKIIGKKKESKDHGHVIRPTFHPMTMSQLFIGSTKMKKKYWP